ncbi:zinc phosphodiesterase ELAC protein 1 isoform X2 [Cynoglossus semilaevis]|uniref:zinc phosphodiesterase ELAC protein 1 isoform X2 n=1 Tax=Cynoglossus semilaevis TaxID=244447 RepID=UPI000495E4DF|nr:zinc phosphodiesterase ELAC protein 1 isoform X2 [Cynoglossus semilaevis]
MTMDLTFLGTGAAYPSPHRGASALVLRAEGDCWLFDCGEGTQTQLMKSQLRVVHELEPTSDQSPAEGQLSLEMTTDSGPLHPQERSGRTITLDVSTDSYLLFKDKVFVVKAFRLFHRIPSFGFCIQEHDRPGRLRTERLKELGLKPGPLYGCLKAGESVTLDSGLVVQPSDVLEDTIPGRKVCILGDCSSILGTKIFDVCHGADVLVHEATLANQHKDKAVDHGHSTPQMAAAVARVCSAKRLVLYHFSQRYKPSSQQKEGDKDDVTELKRQAEEGLQDCDVEVLLAEDFLSVPVPLRR